MKPVCLVIGAGAGIGGNVARKFAQEGYHSVLCDLGRGRKVSRASLPCAAVERMSHHLSLIHI